MDFSSLANRAGKLVADNSPAILTAIGATGAIAAVVLTGKASFRAAEIIAQQKEDTDRYTNEATVMVVRRRSDLGMSDDEIAKETDMPEDVVSDILSGSLVPLSTKAKFNLVWKEYVPAVIVGSIALAAIIGSNRVGARRAAALASAYSLAEKAAAEYKGKVLETLGKNKEEAVRNKVAQDQVKKNPPLKSEIIIVGNGDVLCHDAWSGRYFMSTIQDVKAAMNRVNFIINNYGYCSLTDFYGMVGLNATENSEEVGWNSDKQLDLQFNPVMTEDERPCISIAFDVTPVRNFHKFG